MRLSSGKSCESEGMSSVANKYDCQLAAKYLGLSDTGVETLKSSNRKSYGCIYSSNDWLNWNVRAQALHPSTFCGSSYGGNTYDCLCINSEYSLLLIFSDIIFKLIMILIILCCNYRHVLDRY